MIENLIMKVLTMYSFAVTMGAVLMASCTMGDKGSEKVPDSVSIDTNVVPSQPAAKPSDTTLIDSLQTDTSKAFHKP